MKRVRRKFDIDKVPPGDELLQRPLQPAQAPARQAPTLSISAVERETGLSKDTLRAWERRYGFPRPERDAAGERIYSWPQVEKLRLVRRLMDDEHRPGKVVPMSVEALLRLSRSGRREADDAAPVRPEPRSVLALLGAHDVAGLRGQLRQARVQLGLSAFVTEVVAPLNTLVGDAWMRGQIDIFQEHCYTELAQTALRAGIQSLPEPLAPQRPRVVLSTLPGEQHGLGLLMAEAVFAAEAALCFSLGVQTPVWDLALAADAYRADLVALSFTGCMNPNQLLEGLAELRSTLPSSVQVWAGGSAPALHRRPIAGVATMRSIAELPAALQRWREAHT